MTNSVYLSTFNSDERPQRNGYVDVDWDVYKALQELNVTTTSTVYDGYLLNAVSDGRTITMDVVQEVIDIVNAQKFGKALIGEVT